MGILSKIKKDAAPEEKQPVAKKAKAVAETSGSAQKKQPVASRVLVRPIISEKSSDAERHGTYTFAVVDSATKVDVKRAIQEVYHVLPTRINMMHVEGKQVRFGRRAGKRKDWKKAIVTLPKGKTIHIHEGV